MSQQPPPSFLPLLWKQELPAIVSGIVGGARYGVQIRFPHALIMTLLFRRQLPMAEKLRLIVQLTVAHATRLAGYAGGYKVGLALLKWASRRHGDYCQQRRSLQQHYPHPLGSDPRIFTPLSWAENLLSLLLHGSTNPSSLPPTSTTASAGFPERHHHALIAGILSGYVAWGQSNALNYQVLLYVASRALVGLGKRVIQGSDAATQRGPQATTKQQPLLSQTTTSSDNNKTTTTTSIAYRLVSGLVWGTAMILFEESPYTLHPSMRKSMDEIYRFNLF